MKRHLNTLFVTTDGSYLAVKGETVLVRQENETRLRVPMHMIGGIVCFGNVAASPALLGRCGERGVTVSFLSTYGRFLARVEGRTSGNVLLRREQYRRADDPEASALMARFFVAGKVINTRRSLLRAIRESQGDSTEALEKAAERLAGTLIDIDRCASVDEIRGHEGEAARTYFQVFNFLIKSKEKRFTFSGRSRRPPLDEVNSLLSFVYTLLFHDSVSALEAVGLDPAVGYLHRDRPGRDSLALDLMEEFRALTADRLVLSLINKRQVKGTGFTRSESGAVWMDENNRKAVLTAYQKRKQEEIIHPFLEEKTTVGLLLHLQARLLASFLRGDIDGYPPFVVK